MKILITGSSGFIASHLCLRLLNAGHEVRGIDCFNKYGEIKRIHDDHPNFKLWKLDLTKHQDPITELVIDFDPDVIIHAASRVGGIRYFHAFQSDLLRDNLTMDSFVFSLAIDLYKRSNLKRIIVLSSSMVYENDITFPSREDRINKLPAPFSSYGFSKLSLHYQAKSAYEQHGLPYVLVLPFNAIGTGEDDKDGWSHLIPDLIQRSLTLNPTDILPIYGDGSQTRHFTAVDDIARAIEICLTSDKALNQEFNISYPQGHTVKYIASLIWQEIHGTKLEFQHNPPFKYDVQNRHPDVNKAKEILGFEATIPVEDYIKEIIAEARKK